MLVGARDDQLVRSDHHQESSESPIWQIILRRARVWHEFEKCDSNSRGGGMGKREWKEDGRGSNRPVPSEPYRRADGGHVPRQVR